MEFKYTDEELLESILRNNNKFPISSSKDNLKNKKVDYKVLMLLTLLSNKNTDDEIMETGEDEKWRYIYRNKLSYYQDLVEDLSNNKLNTIFKTIKKMEKLDCKVINVRKTEDNNIVYDINYSNNGREFITVETRIMQSLIHTCNSNAIKIYIILRYLCRKGKKQVSQKWLIDQIGLSEKSKNNYQIITDITDTLHLCGYINKEIKVIDNKNTINVYEVNNFENWKKIRKSKLENN